MQTPETAFRTLYPEVDPATPIPLSTPERTSLTVATAVLAFGGASGDVLVTGVGLILLLLAVIGASRKTGRRIRNEARDRFPQMDWAEDRAESALGLRWVLPLTWLAILAICLVTLWLVPGDWALTGATAAALLSAGLIWFAPGLSPRWRLEKQADEEPAATGTP